MNQSATIDRAFRALADPTRRRILERVVTRERTVGELVEQFDMSQPAITKHLNVLERAGLITRRDEGRTRVASSRREGLNAPIQWMRRYTRLWNDRLDTLEALLADPEFREELDR